MADSTIDDGYLFFFHGRFGPATIFGKDLPGGILGTGHHNVASCPAWLRPGVVAALPLDSGWAEFVYLRYNDAGAPPAMAARQIAIPVAETWTDYTNDPDNAGAQITEGNPLAVVCLSTMTDTYYGWFQCGGKPAIIYVPALNGNFATAVADVVIGLVCSNDLEADAIGLGIVAADTEFPIGYANHADA